MDSNLIPELPEVGRMAALYRHINKITRALRSQKLSPSHHVDVTQTPTGTTVVGRKSKGDGGTATAVWL